MPPATATSSMRSGCTPRTRTSGSSWACTTSAISTSTGTLNRGPIRSLTSARSSRRPLQDLDVRQALEVDDRLHGDVLLQRAGNRFRSAHPTHGDGSREDRSLQTARDDHLAATTASPTSSAPPGRPLARRQGHLRRLDSPIALAFLEPWPGWSWGVLFDRHQPRHGRMGGVGAAYHPFHAVLVPQPHPRGPRARHDLVKRPAPVAHRAPRRALLLRRPRPAARKAPLLAAPRRSRSGA